jgi:dihydropyrimidine dehydrogenase (NAD+) subunit PreT
VGLGSTRRLGVPGEDLPGVEEALAFIEHLKTHPYRETEIGRRVVVIGAGNTAIDAATQARRLGAERVTIVYRRGADEMPAYDYEQELAKQDGCEFRFFTVPKRILGSSIPGSSIPGSSIPGSSRVTGVECVRTESGPSGPDGRRAPVEVPGSEHVIDCDMVLKALGQTAREDLARAAGLKLQDGKMVSTRPNVFVGGDCANGGAEIVNAAAEGKRAAAGIHSLLSSLSS